MDSFVDTRILCNPLKIGGRLSQNRFAINSMECGDSDENGSITQDVINRYKKLLEGNAGLIFIESVTLQLESKARKNQLLLDPYSRENIEGWRSFIRDLKTINPNVLLVIQLNHGGEKCSDVFSKKVCPKPRYGIGGEIVSEEYIEQMMDSFVEATKVLYNIGADGVDLKYGHGYMICNILRPFNDRNWKFGGSWENRSRVPFEITERVRKAIPDKKFLVGSKITMWEGFPGGFGTESSNSPVMDLKEPLDLIRGLEERGSDYFLESNFPSLPRRSFPENVYHHFSMAKIMKEAVKPETVIIGGAYSILSNGNNNLSFMTPEEKTLFYWAEKNILDNRADMIAIGRQSLADALLPKKYIEGNESQIDWCISCDICEKLLHKQEKVGCATYYPEFKNKL